jgi:hypothetical protein
MFALLQIGVRDCFAIFNMTERACFWQTTVHFFSQGYGLAMVVFLGIDRLLAMYKPMWFVGANALESQLKSLFRYKDFPNTPYILRMSLLPLVIGIWDTIIPFVYTSGDEMASDLGYTLNIAFSTLALNKRARARSIEKCTKAIPLNSMSSVSSKRKHLLICRCFVAHSISSCSAAHFLPA